MAQNSILSSLAVFDYSNNKLCDLYDSQNDLIGQAYKITIETNRDDGVKSLSFQIPYMVDDEENFRWAFLKNEYQIRCIYNGKTEWFIAQKPIKRKEKGAIYGDVTCNGVEITLKTKNIYKEFDDTNGIGTLPDLADKVIAGTGWSRGYTDTIYEADGTTEKVRSITSGGKQGSLGLISTLCNLFKCYPVYKSDTKEVEFYSCNNHGHVIEGTVGVNLDSLTVQPDSTDIITRLYVEGEYADDGYIGIDSVNPTGLSYIMNFDYYREIGLFTSSHETALSTYLSDAASYKSSISSYTNSLMTAENHANDVVGQCDLVVYYVATGFTTPKYVYGDPPTAQQALTQGDNVIVLNNNGTYRTETVLSSPSSLIGTGDYGIAKFITGAAGSIGAYEVQIEAKEKEITNLQRKINATTKADKIAEYNAEIATLQAAIQTIYTQTNGLYEQMHSLMKSDGYLYDIDYLRGMVATYQEYLDDAESDFIIAMGDMLRDGYWNNHNYIEGQEQHLFDDATDLLKSMSRPEITYAFNLVRLRKEFGIPIEDFNLNDIFKIYDAELGVNDHSMYIQKITIGIDDESLGSIEVSNKDLALNSHDLGNLLSRMSQLADLIEQKNSLYDRAKAIAKDNTFYANRLNGQIDVLKNKLISTVSGWHTDEQGNMIFLSADGSGAMMLCGAGFMIASEKDSNGDWVWRTFGTSEGFTADEIIAGFISAERIEAGSINVDKLGPGVGGSLVISSNPSIIAAAENIAPAFSTSTAYAIGDIVSYQGVVYKFTSAHAAGDWDASHVTATNAVAQIKVASDAIALTVENTATNVAPAFSISTAYAVGDVVSYQGKIYKFTYAHAAGAWNASHVTQTNINTVSKDAYYGLVSGITINTNGIDITGSKYVKIRSGGSFQLDTPNLKINSADSELTCYLWALNYSGLVLNNSDASLRVSSDSYYVGQTKTTLKIATAEEEGIHYNAISLKLGATDTNDAISGVKVVKESTGYISFCPCADSSYGSCDLGSSREPFPNLYATNIRGSKIQLIGENIQYLGTKSNGNMIRFLDNTSDIYGNGIIIGDGGLVVIGAGESAAAMASGKSAGTEDLYLGADGAVFIYSNVNNGIGSAQQFQFNTSGTFSAPGRIYQNGNQVVPLQDTNTWRGYEIKQYEYTYTVAANSAVSIRASEFGINATPGYVAAAILYFNTSDSNVDVFYLDASATGYNTVAILHNRANSQVSHPMAIKILFLQTGSP